MACCYEILIDWSALSLNESKLIFQVMQIKVSGTANCNSELFKLIKISIFATLENKGTDFLPKKIHDLSADCHITCEFYRLALHNT